MNQNIAADGELLKDKCVTPGCPRRVRVKGEFCGYCRMVQQGYRASLKLKRDGKAAD